MFKALLKKQLREVLSSFTAGRKNRKNKKNKKNEEKKSKGSVGMIVLFAVLFVSLAASFAGMAALFASTMVGYGLDWLFFALMGIVAAIISVVGSVFSTYATLYKAKDNETLLAMPIPPAKILAVRMICVFLLNFVFEITALGPAIGVYYAKTGMRIGPFLSSIWMALMLGAVILVLCCVLGWVVAIISAKLKNRSVITTLISLILLGAYYVFYFRLSSLLQDLAAHAAETGESIKNGAYPFYLFGTACLGDLKSLLIFTAGAAVLLFVTVKVLSANFIKIATTGEGAGKKVSQEQARAMVNTAVSKTGSVKKTLLKRELKHFVSSATYMLNAGLGSVFMLAGAVLLVVKSADVQVIPQLVSALGDSGEKLLEAATAGALLTVSSMNTLTAPSISLEGRNLWIVRSLPVPAKDVLLSKIYMHLIVTLPAVLLLTAAACVVFGMSSAALAQLLIFAVLAVLFEALGGLALNLKNPKFDWTAETVPIKQSGPVAIMIFGGMVLAAALGFGYYKLFGTFYTQYFLSILLAVFALVDALLTLWILKKGTVLFDEL